MWYGYELLLTRGLSIKITVFKQQRIYLQLHSFVFRTDPFWGHPIQLLSLIVSFKRAPCLPLHISLTFW